MSEKAGFTYFGYHVVCLIDVLGQKEKLARWADLPYQGEITPEFREALTQTAGTVLAFREQFMGFFKMLDQISFADKLSGSPDAEQEQYHRCKDCTVNVQRFADTIVFSSLVPNAFRDASVTPLYRVLAACCYAMLWSLAARTPVRGGLSIGTGGELEDGGFYGPAAVEAYRLESVIAGHPRVVISDTVRQFLSEGWLYSKDPAIDMKMKTVAGLCRSLVGQDLDGKWIVDFLGQGMRELLGARTPLVSAVKMAYEFVRSESMRLRRDGDTKLAPRYAALQQYMDSRLHLWSLESDKSDPPGETEGKEVPRG
jgi:hypothetical protein